MCRLIWPRQSNFTNYQKRTKQTQGNKNELAVSRRSPRGGSCLIFRRLGYCRWPGLTCTGQSDPNKHTHATQPSTPQFPTSLAADGGVCAACNPPPPPLPPRFSFVLLTVARSGVHQQQPTPPSLPCLYLCSHCCVGY